MLGRRKRYRDFELAPDEIFLDASNQPNFNTDQLEGRLEQPLSRRSFVGIGIVILLIFIGLTARAATLGIIKGEKYAAQSERNRLRSQVLIAQRGAILDRNGVALVSNEVKDDGTVKRSYLTPGFAHLLGYVSYPKKDASGNYYDTDITGLAGAELAFNSTLAGKNGTILTEEDARGRVQSQGTTVPAQNGKSVTLAIDARAQKAFYDAISSLADKIPFEGGAGVLMDVNTGEVRALVSYPEYDPNVLSAGTPADVIAAYSEDTRQPYLDRAISGLYTPGSIVKPIEASGVLADNIISPSKIIYSSGQISVPNPYDPSKPTIFRDWKVLGALDIRHAIAWSSDVYFYTVGGGFGDQKGLGINRLKYWFEQFGYTTKTGIELPREASGNVPSPEWKQKTFGEPWRIGNTYHTAIGQYGTQITLLEAARSIAAVANGGTLVTPTILKSDKAEGTPPSSPKVPAPESALQIVREGMRLGATEGTSHGLNDLSFVQLAGKTGTAQLGLHNEYYNSWAVGFWPYDKPKYVYVLLMDHGPAGNSLGGIYAMHQVLTQLHETAPEYFP
jgi:penicillin-binding protein 2